jgi:caffeoyl-CoA O-methyltransferase
MEKEIFKSVDEYITQLYIGPDPVLDLAVRAAEKAKLPPISISPVQGKFLQLLARLCNARKILELGTLAGYSTIWLARALPPNGRLVTVESDPAHAAVAEKNIREAGLDSLVKIRVGKALDILPKIEAERESPFDMIFIDADKPPYTEYLQWALKLSRPGTLIVADNVIREGKVLEPDSEDEMVRGVQRFNKALAEDPRVTSIVVQTVGQKDHDGMAIGIVN